MKRPYILSRLRKNILSSDGKPGAIILGGDYQGLGIVRSLGRRGIPICVIDDEYSISRYSRYATVAVRVPDLKNEAITVETLLELGHRLGLEGWVLFPTRDEQVAILSRNRSTLSEFFRVPTPAWSTIQWIWDKRNTYKLAQQLKIPVPRTWTPSTATDLQQIHMNFPIAVKPAIKEHFFYATKAKAWRANTPGELQDLYLKASEITGLGEIMVQDLIPGGGGHQFAFCAFFKEGRALGSMVTRRLRQHPYEFGRASTFVETIEMPALESLSERFLKAINYYGLVEMEFKLDPRDGQCKLLDVNARTWGYHTLGCAAGVDFASLLFFDQLAEAVESCRGRPGVSWIRLLTDIPAGVVDLCHGRIGWKDYVRTIRECDMSAVFSREDLLPSIIECALVPYLVIKRGF